MNSEETNSVMSEEDAKEVLKTAYQHFKSKKYEDCLNRLRPTLKKIQKVESTTTVNFLSMMWSLAGDAFKELKSIDEAIIAYRKSLDLDENSGCLHYYTWLVAKYELEIEMPYAYERLVANEHYIKEGQMFWRLVAFFTGILFMPGTWWDMNVRSKIVKRKLRRMANKL